jgi:hypothetical protein
MIERLHTTLCNVPVNIAIDATNDSPKGVFYLIHGHTGNKEDVTIRRFQTILAQMGYEAISLDAYAHGSRIAPPYTSTDSTLHALAMPEVVKHTLQDIALIHQTHYLKNYHICGVLGISMGGHVAYLAPQFMPFVNIIIPLIGAPHMARHYLKSKSWLADKTSEIQHILDELQVINLEMYQHIHILQINGTKDDVVHYENAFDFHVSLPKAQDVEHWFVLEEVGHIVNEAMVSTVTEFMNKIDPLLERGRL